MSQFKPIKGFQSFSKNISRERSRLQKQFEKRHKRTFDPAKDYIKSKPLYDSCGKLSGFEIKGKYSFDLVLSEEYPQLMYWFAMRFICAIPHEAVDFYNPGKKMTGLIPMNFNMHPVGSGPYMFKWDEFRKQQKIVMVKNPNWWGLKIAAPTTRFPKKPHSDEDIAKGYWTPESAGRPLAQADRIEWYKETESLTRFGKFMQGFYDSNSIPPEKLDELLSGQQLSEEMKKQQISLNKSAKINVRYIGFNMQDDIIGAPKKFRSPQLEQQRQATLQRNKKLRQAMNLAIDIEEYIRVQLKGMGNNCETLLPPGIPGYDKNFLHPYKYRSKDSLNKARQLLEEAGYKNGINPATGKPLELTFTFPSRGAEDFTRYEFFIKCWAKIGLNIKADGNEYSQFQKKVYNKNFQIFTWGWYADYPDAENFLFLLTSDMSGTANHALYENPEYDFYFNKLKPLTPGASTSWIDKTSKKTITMTRKQLIEKCLQIFSEDCPWVMLNSDIDFQLYHSWLKNNRPHPLLTSPLEYYDVDTGLRQQKRQQWNQPIIWPAYLLALLLIALIIPAVLTYYKERN